MCICHIDLSELNTAMDRYGDKAHFDGILGADVLNGGHAIIDYNTADLYLLIQDLKECTDDNLTRHASLLRGVIREIAAREAWERLLDGEVESWIDELNRKYGPFRVEPVLARHHGDPVAGATAENMDYSFPVDNLRRV
jgi:hypothetical protein